MQQFLRTRHLYCVFIKRQLLNEKLKISEILFLKKVYSMKTKPDQIAFSFSVHDFQQKFPFWFYLKKNQPHYIIYNDKTLNYLENDRFSVSSQNELNMDYDINRMMRLIICFCGKTTLFFFRGAYDIDQRDFPSLVSNQAGVTSTLLLRGGL